MNRINQLYKNKTTEILSVYFTAGFPELESTRIIIKNLQEAGANIVEIGMPFSDPIADGPTIQMSNQKALDNGMTIKKLFEQLEGFRNEISLPVILMGYINPVLQYGIEKFCKDCQRLGIDGLILPDLPMDVYQESYKSLFEAHGLKMVFLVTPQTADERIRLIDERTDAFIYLVSSSSTTGGSVGISNQQEEYFKRIQTMKLKNPCLIGFGISDHASFQKASQYTSGAIVGSAFIRMLEASKSIEVDINEFVKKIMGS